MTFKVHFNGGTREEVMEALDRQMQSHLDSKSMSEDSASAIRKLVDALPGDTLAGTIQDNNAGSMSIQLVTNTTVPVQTVATRSTGRTSTAPPSNANRPMEGRVGNEGGVDRGTTAPGGPVPVKPTGAQDAKAASQATAAAAKPTDTK